MQVYEPLLSFDGAEYILNCLYKASFQVKPGDKNGFTLPAETEVETDLATAAESFEDQKALQDGRAGSRLGWGKLVKPYTPG